MPVLVKRKIFFSHRDLDVVLKDYLQGKKFYLYTGRGPSGPMHIGHIIPFIFTKYLQEKFDAELYIQITSDEKYLYHEDYSPQLIEKYTKENILDIISIGLDENKTYIIDDLEDINILYPLATSIARKINFSVVRAVFGFNESTNIGLVYFPAIQAVPCFLGYLISEKNKNCLIPAAVDQDPYWRVTRDVAPKLGFKKPAQIHGKFLPSLKGKGKMSSSKPETSVYLSDDPSTIKKKIWNAFTGGQATIKEQKEKGGKPEVCSIYSYFYYMFELDDKKMKEIYMECITGRRTCGDCKQELADKVINFINNHQKKRKKSVNRVSRYRLSEKVSLEELKESVYKLLR